MYLNASMWVHISIQTSCSSYLGCTLRDHLNVDSVGVKDMKCLLNAQETKAKYYKRIIYIRGRYLDPKYISISLS